MPASPPLRSGRRFPRRRPGAAGWWMTASMLLTAAWILSVQARLLALSVLVIAALLVALIVAFVRLRRDPAGTMADAILFDGTTGLFLGWVMVATVANIAAALAASGFAGWGIDREVWGMAVLGVVAVIGSALAVGDRGRFAPAAASAWGLSWIGLSRLAGSLPSVPVAVAAFAAAGLIVLVAVVVRVVSCAAEADAAGARPGS